jgi:hypothetical protein
MALKELLRERRTAIAERWLDKTLAAYPPDGVEFFKRERDQFANPVGQTLSSGIDGILKILFERLDPPKLCRHLEDIIKIRSVQDLPPSKAVGFVFLLKDAIREELGDELHGAAILAQWLSFQTQIDQTTLFAFDVYVKCREKMYEIRVDEVKRRVATLIKRSDYFITEPESESD